MTTRDPLEIPEHAALRMVAEHARVGLALVSPERRYVYANTAYMEMLGIGPSSAIGDRPLDILSEADHPQLRQGLDGALSGERGHSEWTKHDADGDCHYGISYEPTPREGSAAFVTIVITNVTERRRTEAEVEAALRVERDRAQRYLDTAEVILIALDVEGRVTLINRKGCELLGWSESELLGRDWFATFIPRRAQDSLTKKFHDSVDGDLPIVEIVENPIVAKGGEERLIEWRNRVLRDAAGRVIGTLSSGTDVTSRRALEAQYNQAQKMEAVGRLAGGVAHDFNNLLSAILGYSQLLMDDLDPLDPHLSDLEQIHKAGLSAARLTRQLLAFSRKEVVEPTVLSLNSVAASVREMLGRVIGKDITVVMNLDRELADVLADRGQIEQILVNLAVNARDAMPQGGTLTIETTNIEPDDHQAHTHLAVNPGAYVRLMVSDTGMGMSPETQARVFDPFFTTKELGKGTGLGLAIVHGIVTRAGGCIRVCSELGRGTSFYVYFPRSGGERTVVATMPPDVWPRATGETVLVVEDEEALRELARRMLTAQGYTVLLAANAREAIQQFEEQPAIDLILTDVIMPGGSGPELTKLLLQQRPGLKFVYMSGYTDDAISQQGVLYPGLTYLQKPFTAETLARRIRQALDYT